MDIKINNLAEILGDQGFDMQSECRRYFEYEIMAEASAAQSETQQNKLSDLARQARAEVTISDNNISARLYYLSIPDGVDSYAEFILSNAYSVIKSRINDMVQDRLATADVKNRLAESCKEPIIQKIQEQLGGVLK
jgi:hypothetical protein